MTGTLQTLYRRARTDASARLVLADALDDDGREGWARWMRGPVEEDAGWRALGRAFGNGVKLRLVEPNFSYIGAQGPDILGQRHLVWKVQTPTRLAELLDNPVFYRTTRFHLVDARGRTGIPVVLDALAAIRPDLAVLEIRGRTTDPRVVRGFEELRQLGLRLPRSGRPTTLDVRSLTLYSRTWADLLAFEVVGVPRLEELVVRDVAPGRPPPTQREREALSRVFDRGIRVVRLDDSMRKVLSSTFAGLGCTIKPVVDPVGFRRTEPDSRRWMVEA